MSTHKYGLDVAIGAFACLSPLWLTIVGQGRLEGWLRQLATRIQSPTSFLTESVPHGRVPERYGRFDFFVAASRLEGQGLEMCEAMASDLPVVATQVGGIPEIVRGRMGRSALALAKEKYNWTRDEAALLDAYRQFGILAGMGAR